MEKSVLMNMYVHTYTYIYMLCNLSNKVLYVGNFLLIILNFSFLKINRVLGQMKKY